MKNTLKAEITGARIVINNVVLVTRGNTKQIKPVYTNHLRREEVTKK